MSIFTKVQIYVINIFTRKDSPSAHSLGSMSIDIDTNTNTYEFGTHKFGTQHI